MRHGEVLPDPGGLRLLRGPGGVQQRPREADELAPELVRGNLIAHVVVSPLGVELEVMLALKLICFPEKFEIINTLILSLEKDLLVIVDDAVSYMDFKRFDTLQMKMA